MQNMCLAKARAGGLRFFFNPSPAPGKKKTPDGRKIPPFLLFLLKKEDPLFFSQTAKKEAKPVFLCSLSLSLLFFPRKKNSRRKKKTELKQPVTLLCPMLLPADGPFSPMLGAKTRGREEEGDRLGSFLFSSLSSLLSVAAAAALEAERANPKSLNL